MPPKQVKKSTTTNEKPIDIESVQKEWSDNIKEIIAMREKLSVLESTNEKLIAKLWELMNKSPTAEVVIQGEETPNDVSVEKVIKKKDAEEITETPVKVVKKKAADKPVDKPADKPVDKPKPTKKKVEVVEEPEQEDEEEPVVKPAVKAAVKTAVKQPAKKKIEKPEIEKPEPTPVKKEVKGKIAAPSKGTPKQKVASKEIENDNPTIEDTSSDETDIDSLSSVSSESDASGGEDD